jgi:hypothetical protein
VSADRSSARQVKSTLLQGTGKIDASVKQVMAHCDPEVADLYRRLAGRVMGLIYTNLLMPLYAEHPDLEPSELARAGDAKKHAIPGKIADEVLIIADEMGERVKESLHLARSLGATSLESAFRAGAEEVFEAIRDIELFVGQAGKSQEE